MLANESTFISKLLEDLTGRRGREARAEDGSKAGNDLSDRDFCKAILGSGGRAGEDANGALPIEIRDTFLPLSSDVSSGARARDRRGAGGSGIVPGKRVKCADVLDAVAPALIRLTDWAAVAAAPVSTGFIGSEAVESILYSDASANVPSEVVVLNIGLMDGLIGLGLAIADVGLGTYRTECVTGISFGGFCLDSKSLTREFVAPTMASSLGRDSVAWMLTTFSTFFCKGDGWREFGVELMDFCVLKGIDLEVACKAAA